ncbi:TPA: protein translocase subunit SecF [Candidatus Dependentiae bacterium]|nr:MAG: Protein translocase subunit SecF [candidate division TM6 bacterium GW2011_GWE2_31_21]KKP53205.1 MAG: Protein translocase subunit SecF [candidate division TM6 bacterium GW2011_GWF2_33_332]HBS48023.1 protein translocase subunit SecF [Candidatus Dependentiae bacterium]HBZ73373.1 protein translocase subunit SecF [Candidatus Dependentiae bacterium]
MIDFLKYRYFFVFWSALLLAVGIVVGSYNYYKSGNVFQYHIDFVGGTELNVNFENPIKISEFRSALDSSHWTDLSIQSIGTANSENKYKEFVVRTKDTSDNIEHKFLDDVNAKITSNKVTISGVSRVGAEVGKDIKTNAIIAVILALLIILFYIALRSKYRFGVGAVASLIHDLLAVMVIIMLLGEQISISVMAAVLSVLGYSLHDTIIIFSRIRENFKKMKGKSEFEIANISINQTLNRTLLTSFATLLTIVAILIFGGEILRGFAIVMFVGIIVGTYSSIYIASPVMLAIKSKSSEISSSSIK